MYRLIVLAPSTGGKTTLVRYLRDNSPDLPVYEIDEEIMRENGEKWPEDDKYKNKVLIPRMSRRIAGLDEAIFFSSYIPDEILKESKENGFRVLVLDISIDELKRRNEQRIEEEGYDDSSSWLELQRDTNLRLIKEGIADSTIDGHKATRDIAEAILAQEA